MEPQVSNSYADTAFRATNNKRKQHHRAALRHNDCLQKYAVRNAKRMARREVMEHQDLGPIMDACNLNSVGENVAYGYPTVDRRTMSRIIGVVDDMRYESLAREAEPTPCQVSPPDGLTDM